MSDLKFMLAKEFEKGKHDVKGWLISEKFDGYRACFSNKDNGFFSRQNKPFNAPEWFIRAMPPRLVDGELWIGRNMFQEMGVVRKKIPLDEDWYNVTFQVYDLPDFPGTFKERIHELLRLCKVVKKKWKVTRKDYPYPINTMDCPVVFASQTIVRDDKQLDEMYTNIIKNGGEGIMLKDPMSLYEGKRSNSLLKYKPAFDAEAIIVDYKAGCGKYKGMLGGFICKQLINHDTYMSIDENEDHIFSISGMDDAIRSTYKETHPIGTIISYECSGKTDKGKPRFGRYLRIRTDITIKAHTEEPIHELVAKVVTILKALGDNERNNGEPFKSGAYYKAIKGIYELDELNETTIRSIKGVGKSLCEKIMDIVNTGTCPQYEKIKNIKDARTDFLEISGVGPKKASELVSKGFTSIDDLRKEPNLDKLLNDKQLIGLKYYEDILQRIPREEIDKHDLYLKGILKEIDPTAEMTIAGSYRRGLSDSGDIDILLKGDTKLYKQFIQVLESKGYLYETLAKGAKKYNGMCKMWDFPIFRRIDIMITKPAEYPFAILYFTGSKEFNTKMRQYALDLGYSMNEYSLTSTEDGTNIDENQFKVEQDIFKFLHLEYVDPCKR